MLYTIVVSNNNLFLQWLLHLYHHTTQIQAWVLTNLLPFETSCTHSHVVHLLTVKTLSPFKPQQSIWHACCCSAFALEAARLLKEKGNDASPAPTPPPAAEDPEDGELPEAPAAAAAAAAPEETNRKRKHSPIVWREGGKQPGRSHLLSVTAECSAYKRDCVSCCSCASLCHILVTVECYTGVVSVMVTADNTSQSHCGKHCHDIFAITIVRLPSASPHACKRPSLWL